MYEDVCLQCGKPLTNGRAYCSYDCKSLDATSPSISTASSNFPSPNFGFTMSPTPDKDIPALLPTALGGSGGPLQNYSRYRNINNLPAAVPRYSALSAWPSGHYTEDESDHPDHAALYDPNEKHIPSSGLNYARRPSSTNRHSTIPRPHLVRPSDSGASSPVRSSVGIPRSAPPLALSPTPPSSGADDELSDGTNDKESTLRATKITSLITKKPSKKRNRASLPPYFSLLVLTSPSSGKRSSRDVPPIAGVTTSRNAPKSSHMKAAPSITAITPMTVHAHQPDSSFPPFEKASFRGRAERGRSKHRGPDSSTSPGARNDSRDRSPPRLRTIVSSSRSSTTAAVSVSPCLHASRRRHRGQRVGSQKGVSDWVSTSTDLGSRLRSRPRRYSNESEESVDCNWRPGGEQRGRRRTNELDISPTNINGPGFGNGRSGLRDRERRGVVVQGLVH